MRLAGKVAIITGAARGLGRAYALRMAREGAAVAVADIEAEMAAAVAAEITAADGRAMAVKVDVADEASVAAMAEAVAAQFGGIDILVNNAALWANLPRRPFWEITPAEFDRVMAVNVKGVFLCCRAVWPSMRARGGGKIINISSGTIFNGTGNLPDYVTSKAAVIGLTRALARDLGDFGITVNTIAPGVTDSGAANAVPEVLDRKAAAGCIKRREAPQDVEGTVVFLASADSDFITGQTLVVDGGRVMW
ncbi:MAG: glucose 1-dehydrogenase [Anaerolineae bacterium]